VAAPEACLALTSPFASTSFCAFSSITTEGVESVFASASSANRTVDLRLRIKGRVRVRIRIRIRVLTQDQRES